jgi:hypothetical protein
MKRKSPQSRTRTEAQAGAIDSPLPNLEAFVLRAGGHLSVGAIGPIAYAAVASDNYNMYAALQRRDDETLMQLLQRLDAALLHALQNDMYTDEING